jgi:hypothetical protein
MYAWGRRYRLAANVVATAMPMAAMAQQPPNVPSTIAPGAIHRELEKPLEPVAPPPSQPRILGARPGSRT